MVIRVAEKSQYMIIELVHRLFIVAIHGIPQYRENTNIGLVVGLLGKQTLITVKKINK